MRHSLVLICSILPSCTLDPSSSTASNRGTQTPPLPNDCLTSEVGLDGETLIHDGATLVVPPNALVDDTVVTLCPTETDDPDVYSEIWTVGPEDLTWTGSLILDIHHTAADAATLFVPGSYGPERSWFATVPAVDTLRGDLTRPGAAWVARDDRVEQPYLGSADLLFVIDNSCSMADEQDLCANAMPGLWDAVEASSLDLHVGVVSTDTDVPSHSGKLREVAGHRWVEPDTEEAVTVLSAMLQMGVAGSGTERGLGASFTAIELLGDGYNAGFRREGAALAIVVLSDEDDQTQDFVITQTEYVDWLDSLTDPFLPSAFHGIVSPDPIGTYSSETYTYVAEQTGGWVLDIKSTDYLPFLVEILDSIGLEGSLTLPGDVDPESIEAWTVGLGEAVRIDPALVVYDPVERTVTVDYEPLDEVVVLYTVL